MEGNLLVLIGKYSFVILVPLLVSFIFTYYTIRWWIILARKIGLVGKDMHKLSGVMVAESGGIWVILGITMGLLSYLFLKTYIFGTKTHLVEILTVIVICLLASFLGFIDDLIGWKKGLKPWQKPLLTLPIAIPLAVLKLGHPILTLPIVGSVNLGVLYSLILVPLGIVGAANGFNMIAGYNGLEASMGIILFLGLFLKFLEIQNFWLSYICLIIIFAIFAFLLFNRFPARIFPGDSFTHAIGALYATLVIIGNVEKFGVVLFTLYFLELLLFVRGLVNGVYKENFGKVGRDGKLYEPYPKIYSLTHLAIRVIRKFKGRCYEKDVVLFLALLQLVVLAFALWIG